MEKMEIGKSVAVVLAEMNAYKIVNDGNFVKVGEAIKRCKEMQRQVKQVFDPDIVRLKEEKKKIDKEIKSIEGKMDQYLVPLEEAEKILKGKLAAYQMEAERKRKEEEERQRKQAEEQARIAKQKIEDQLLEVAIETGNEAVLEANIQVAVPKIEPLPATPKIEGVSFRTVYRYEIIDPMQIPREFLMPNEKAIQAYVNETKAEGNIPGVRMYVEKIVASR